MLFSSTLAILSAALTISAAPSTNFASVLTSSASALRELPIGKTAISRGDMREIRRLAQTVNSAYCPQDRQLQPIPVQQTPLQGGSRHQRREVTKQYRSSVLITSDDIEFAHLADEVDMSWYISHTPETQTLTLAFSSLPSVDDLLELLASEPADNSTETLIDLPAYLYPPEAIASVQPPKIFHSYLPALESHGTAALLAVLDLIESPPVAPVSPSNVLAGYLFGSSKQVQTSPIKHVEITGHGLGSAVGLLTALALHLEVTGPAAASYDTPLESVDITTALFGLPRVGDQVFADWVDQTVNLANTKGSILHVNRINSYADTINHLPARHLNLAHPSQGEIWISADPRMAYACRSEVDGEESNACSQSITLQRTSLLDHAGPFAGVWLGTASCRRSAYNVKPESSL